MLKTLYNLYIKRAQLKIDIGENNNMIVEKNLKKVFTKEESNNIIRKKYNPLKAKKFEREGLCMKEKDILLEEIIKQLNFIERIFFKKKFIKIYKNGITYGFNNK